MKALSAQEWEQTGVLYSDTLKKALERYENGMVCAKNAEDMKQYLNEIFRMNVGKSYADFYYPAFTASQKEVFRNGLTEEETVLFHKLKIENNQIFYLVGQQDLDFLYSITFRSWLFSTFYFTDKKVTVWGNYNLEFPVFCEDKETLAVYMELAGQCGLERK